MKIIFAIVLVCLPTFVLAQAPPTAAEIKEWRDAHHAWGDTACKELLWQLAPPDQPIARIAYGAYTQGFLDGIIYGESNAVLRQEQFQKFLDFGSSGELLLAHIREYCQRHPSETVEDAAVALYLKIMGRD